MTYTQRLEYLDLPSLWHRRLRGDMIQVFKIINNNNNGYNNNNG